MEITSDDTQQTQSISDDQELAKALAGIADGPELPAPAPVAAPTPEIVRTIATPADPVDPSALVVPPVEETPELPVITLPEPTVEPVTTDSNSDLTGIKQTALSELRPLIDRLDLPVEEKFDTYLMLIRSTDDTTLIAPAHAAAASIPDEKRKAQALLDIIKEIDFLAPPAPQA